MLKTNISTLKATMLTMGWDRKRTKVTERASPFIFYIHICTYLFPIFRRKGSGVGVMSLFFFKFSLDKFNNFANFR